MNYTCPVCAFQHMEGPPADYEICPCCGTEFGHDDEVLTHSQLRLQWIANGATWFFNNPPLGWNPWYQLIAGDLIGDLPFHADVVLAGAYTTSVNNVNSELAVAT